MEEEKMVKEENEITNITNSNNKNSFTAILVVIIIALVGVVIYFAFIKKDDKPINNNSGNNQNSVSLTDDEAIAIAKEKLNMANTFFKDSCDSDDIYSEEGIGSLFCYYDTLNNFSDNFFNIYSKQLKYENVYSKYTGSEDFQAEKDYMFSYAVKDGKVYHDRCTMGGDIYEGIDNYKVNSLDENKIEISYKVNYSTVDGKEQRDGKIELVKEDNNWKILKATIIGWCSYTVEVGK